MTCEDWMQQVYALLRAMREKNLTVYDRLPGSRVSVGETCIRLCTMGIDAKFLLLKNTTSSSSV